MNSLVGSGCLLAVLMHVGSAIAQPRNTGAARIELRNETGTDQCLGAAALERAVDYRLRRRAFRADLPATLYISVMLRRDPETGWSAEIAVRDADTTLLGTRNIASSARHCSSLDESLALVVALLVDDPPSPEVPVEPPATPPTPNAAPTPTDTAATHTPTPPPSDHSERKAVVQLPVPGPSRITLPPDTHAPREPWRVAVQASGALAFGLLPGAAPGVEVGVELAPPHGPAVELFGASFFARRAERASGSAGADFNASAIGLGLCPLSYERAAFRWAACGGQSVGWVSVKSFGFDVDSASSHLRYALLGWSGLELFMSRAFAVRFGARVEVPLSREIFEYSARDGSEPALYETSPIAALLDVGFLARL